MRSMLFVAAVISAVLATWSIPARATSGVQTAASLKLQEKIFGFLGYRSSKECARPSPPEIVSSKHAPDAKFSGHVLVSGEIQEVWQIDRCGTTVRYLFRLAPGKEHELGIVGLERMP
jgi:hypothetical protein